MPSCMMPWSSRLPRWPTSGVISGICSSSAMPFFGQSHHAGRTPDGSGGGSPRYFEIEM